MRGGEGHARAIEYAYFTRPGELSIPFFHNSRAKVRFGGWNPLVRQSTGYPYTGSVKLDVVSSTVTDPVLVRFAAPSWTSGHRLLVKQKIVRSAVRDGFVESWLALRSGDTLQLNFDLQSGAADALNPGSIPAIIPSTPDRCCLGAKPTRRSRFPAMRFWNPRGPATSGCAEAAFVFRG